jgi:competence protein ComGC
MRRQSGCKTSAFKLVELLVVIAIIVLLLSVLMPALSKVREQAKSLVCAANKLPHRDVRGVAQYYEIPMNRNFY